MAITVNSNQFKVPLSFDEQRELIGALRSANVKIIRYEKSLSELTLLVQELMEEPRNKNKRLAIMEKTKGEQYGNS